MAIVASVYSPNQFLVGLIAETTLGTKNVTTMKTVNVDPDSVSITENPVIDNDPRTGSGRTLKSATSFTTDKGVVKQISFSGICDTTVLPILVANCMGIAVSTAPASYDIAYNYTPPETKIGDTDTDATGALTFAYDSPYTNHTLIYPGCFTDELEIIWDAMNDGGRAHFNAKLLSGCIAETEATSLAGMVAMSSTYYSIHDLFTKCSVGGVDIVMSKLVLKLKANTKHYGSSSTGVKQVISRGVPIFDVDLTIGMKYDSNTATLYESYSDNPTVVAVEISNNATWASATVGLKASYCWINADAAVPGKVEEGAYIDLQLKAKAHTSGDLIQVVV